MKTLLRFSLAAALLAPVFATTVSAGETKGARPRKVERPERRANAPRVVWTAPSNAKPCDSTACRPIRFAWSPTAPGS
ncbi:MAG: hypothetical protein ABMA13_02600 [Chthoniobacteraceae bacterium]